MERKKKKHQGNARRPQVLPAWKRRSCALTTLQCAPQRFVFLGPLWMCGNCHNTLLMMRKDYPGLTAMWGVNPVIPPATS